MQLNWITLSLCLTELCVWYIFYHLRSIQLHRNCLTVRRTVYQCHKYGRLLTINDDAQFNVSFRSSMTHTNYWLYLMFDQTWHLSYQQTVNVQLSGTQISDVHTLRLCLCHNFPPSLQPSNTLRYHNNSQHKTQQTNVNCSTYRCVTELAHWITASA